MGIVQYGVVMVIVQQWLMTVVFVMAQEKIPMAVVVLKCQMLMESVNY